VRALSVGRDHRGVPEVDDPELVEGVDSRFEVRPGWTTRRADRPRRKASSRPVGDQIVGRGSDDRDVRVLQLGGILRVRGPAEAQQARVVRLFAELPPTLKGIDQNSFCSFIAAPISPRTLSFPVM
jgi:hypothetical protein